MIGDEGMRVMSEVLRNSGSGPLAWFSRGANMRTTLTSLNLSSDYQGRKNGKQAVLKDPFFAENGITDRGCKVLSEAMKNNTTLTNLNLYGCA